MKKKIVTGIIALTMAAMSSTAVSAQAAVVPCNSESFSSLSQLQGIISSQKLPNCDVGDIKSILQSCGINVNCLNLNGIIGSFDCPTIPEIPVVPEIPDIEETPDTPSIPETPDNEETPDAPSIPETPDIEETPDAPIIPDVSVEPETPETPEESKPEGSSFAQQVVSLVNIERAKEGLSPLSIDNTIGTAALVRAKEIQTSFSHTRPEGKHFSTALSEAGVKYTSAGENIAWGQRTPEEVVSAWMNSAGHRANIMNAGFSRIGVGHLMNSSGTSYWVQLFAN